MGNIHDQENGIGKKKRLFSWKKMLFGAILLIFSWFIAVPFFAEDLTGPVTKQLKALKENRLTEAYFKYTTHDFQENTTLQQFKDFFSQHPEITKNASFDYSDSSVNNNLGWLEGKINGEDGKQTDVQFGLKKQDDEWRIYAIKIGESEKSSPVTDPKQIAQLIEPIENQLQLFKKKDLKEAYDAVVSKEFKENTSLAEFKKFVERYPMLLDYSNVVYKGYDQGTTSANVLVELIGEHATYPVTYKLIKEDNHWKIWNMHLVIPLSKESTKLKANLEVLESTVKNHLQFIKENKLKEAYQSSVTKSFKDVTPYEKFETFVEAFPILANYKSLEFGELGMEDNSVGVIQVDFYSSSGMTVIEYTLSQEDGDWKILGINVVDHKESTHHDTMNAKGKINGALNKDLTVSTLTKVIEEQINLIKKGMIHEAYFTHTSEDFQKATDMSTFESFMKKHPAYVNHESSKFGDMTFNSNIATIKGELVTKKGTRFPVEYDLVMENDEWKVLHVEIQAPISDLAEK